MRRGAPEIPNKGGLMLNLGVANQQSSDSEMIPSAVAD